MKRAFLFLFFAAITVYTTSESRAADSWAVVNFDGLALTLEHPRYCEYDVFASDGTVATTYGMKNGPITFPCFSWRIEGPLLVFREDDGKKSKIVRQWRLIKSSTNQVVVVDTINGETLTFAAKHNKPDAK